MILRIVIGLVLSATLHGFAALPPDYEKLKADAEKLSADGSFALAHEAYQKAAAIELPPPEKRWVEFRLADTQLRSQAATQTADTTKLDDARQKLAVLIRDITRVEDHDRVWAEVQESLGVGSYRGSRSSNTPSLDALTRATYVRFVAMFERSANNQLKSGARGRCSRTS